MRQNTADIKKNRVTKLSLSINWDSSTYNEQYNASKHDLNHLLDNSLFIYTTISIEENLIIFKLVTESSRKCSLACMDNEKSANQNWL